jgi:hypothetical protein
LRLTDLHNLPLRQKELENNMRFLNFSPRSRKEEEEEEFFSSLEEVSEQATSVFALVALQSYFTAKQLRRGSSYSITVSNLFKFGCHCGFLQSAPMSAF